MRGRGDRGRDPRRREEGLEEGDAGHVQEDLAAGPHQYIWAKSKVLIELNGGNFYEE